MDNNQTITNRKSRKQAASTLQSLAFLSPQLILETEDEETTDTEKRIYEDLAVTSSDYIEEDEEANTFAEEPSTTLQESTTVSNTRIYDEPSMDYENTVAQPLHHIPSTTSYYGTPIFFDPESSQQIYGSTMTGSTEVSWSHPESADETTRLLAFGDNGSSSDNLLGSKNVDEILRPSIFTSLGANNKFT